MKYNREEGLMMMQEMIGQASHWAWMIVSSMESGSKMLGHLNILHEGTWNQDNKKVRKKVELYDDFKWSSLREATQFLLIYNMTIYIFLFNWTIK
jgi:hypothetical protein